MVPSHFIRIEATENSTCRIILKNNFTLLFFNKLCKHSAIEATSESCSAQVKQSCVSVVSYFLSITTRTKSSHSDHL
jgi:hypothetical protein